MLNGIIIIEAVKIKPMDKNGILSAPSIDHNGNIIFVYCGNLYRYHTKSSQQLTFDEEINYTAISPNGTRIAFSSIKNGSNDIYLISGNSIKRITHYCAESIPIIWKNENELIIRTNYFTNHLSRAVNKLFTYNCENNMIIDNFPNSVGANFISFDEEKKPIFQMHGYGYKTFQQYKGGSASKLFYQNDYIMQEDKYNHERPHIINNDIYYMSCKADDSVGQIYKNDAAITNHKYYIDHLSSNGKELIYSSGGEIYIYENNNINKVLIDLSPIYDREIKTSLNSSADYFLHENGSVNIVSNGKLYSKHSKKDFEYNEFDQKKKIFYSSSYIYDKQTYAVGYDINSSYIDQYSENNKFVKRIEINNNKYRIKYLIIEKDIILATTQTHELIRIHENGMITQIDKSSFEDISDLTISRNGAWIAYCKYTTPYHSSLILCNLNNMEIHAITKNQCYESSPVFMNINNRDYLFFLSGKYCKAEYTDFGGHDLLIEHEIHPFAIYLNDDKYYSLFMNDDSNEEKEQDFSIEINNIQNRIEQFRSMKDNKIFKELSGLAVNDKTLLLYTNDIIYKYDFTNLKLSELTKGRFICSNNNGHILISDTNNNIKTLEISNINEEEKHSLNKTILISEAEYKNAILFEAWNLQTHYCFKLNNNQWIESWKKIFLQYQELMNKALTEFNIVNVIYEMYSHLNSSHAYVMYNKKKNEIAYSLGCEYQLENGQYKITKLYDIDQANKNITIDINRIPNIMNSCIKSVNGRVVDSNNTIEKILIDRKISTIEIDDNEYRIHCTNNISAIRYDDWVNNNRDNANKKEIGYIHIPDMSNDGFEKFYNSFRLEGSKRYDFIIIDARYNGGGNVSSNIIKTLEGNTILGYDYPTHSDVSIPMPWNTCGSKFILLCNENTGSDGDIFTYMFKQKNLGITIGTRTWGGVVGMCRRSVLVNGKITVTQPEFPSYFFEGKKKIDIENNGVTPDLIVNHSPTDSRDLQMEKAIEVILQNR